MLRLRACLVVVALFTACDKKQAPPKEEPKPVVKAEEPKPEPPKPTAPETAPDPFADWSERKGDGFSVLAPQEPKVDKGQSMAAGTKSETTIYTHYVPDGPGAIQVMFAQLDKTSKPDAKTMFAAMQAAMMKPFDATNVKQQDASIGKVKGEELWFDGTHPQMGGMQVHVKFLLDADKKRLYLVQGMWSTAATDFAAKADKFVASFKLQ
jgi:hypothetical protein